MRFMFLIYFLKLFYEARTYENIALHKPAWQQHIAIGMGADRAVDGRYSDLSGGGGQCSISGYGHTTAEWRVDLGDVHSIDRIFIQYLTENALWNGNNSYASDFLGFSLYISNTTRKEDWVLCFKDTTYTKETIPNPLNISCRLSGRYVIYYNNRTHLPFPEDYSEYAVFTLCEIEVYGCPNVRYYGDNCSTPCHQNCLDGRCDVVDGTCVGCVPGYTGSMCDTGCK